jgi:exopolysaccharide production protein ExoQ
MPKALTPLFISTAIFGLGLNFDRPRLSGNPSRFLLLLFVSATLLYALSWFWTITPHETLRLILPLSGLIFLGLAAIRIAFDLNVRERQTFCYAIVFGITVGLIVLLIEIFSPLAITKFLFSIFKGLEIEINYTYMNFFRNGANIAALIIFPATAILWRKGKQYFAISLMLLALVTLTYSKAGGALLALLVGLAAIAITYTSGRYARILFGSILVVSALALPFAVSVFPSAGEIEERYPDLPNSVYPRIFIWQSSAQYIFKNPFIGKGFNSSRAISKPEDWVEFSTKGKSKRRSVPIPLHPHSAIIQIWLELGVVGIGLFLALLLTLIKRIEQLTPSLSMRAMAYGSFFSAFTIANVSYGIWQNWWISALWLTATFTIIATRDDPPSTDEHEPVP